MKFLIAGVLLFSIGGYAHDENPKPKAEGSVETIVKEVKKGRKKKAEMCHECGKPEEKCDCEGEEHRKSE